VYTYVVRMMYDVDYRQRSEPDLHT
jgi:hypothetical protein